MEKRIPPIFHLHPDVVRALQSANAIVALESTVITHGLPRPQNLQLARELEAVVKLNKAVPATIALLSGKIHIGLSDAELEYLALQAAARKISRRDFSLAIASRSDGGTTVAGTLFAAHKAGIRVFATGGIGGVHRGSTFDISADLNELRQTPLVVVCSGAKAILDLPATREVLESYGVPVIGYRTDEMPAFYTPKSGLSVDLRVENAAEIAEIARSHWSLGLSSAILVVNPPPAEASLPPEVIEDHIALALAQAEDAGVTGAAITPFLLAQVSRLSDGESLKTNLTLLRSNAALAAEIACAIQPGPRVYHI